MGWIRKWETEGKTKKKRLGWIAFKSFQSRIFKQIYGLVKQSKYVGPLFINQYKILAYLLSLQIWTFLVLSYFLRFFGRSMCPSDKQYNRSECETVSGDPRQRGCTHFIRQRVLILFTAKGAKQFIHRCYLEHLLQ